MNPFRVFKSDNKLARSKLRVHLEYQVSASLAAFIPVCCLYVYGEWIVVMNLTISFYSLTRAVILCWLVSMKYAQTSPSV